FQQMPRREKLRLCQRMCLAFTVEREGTPAERLTEYEVFVFDSSGKDDRLVEFNQLLPRLFWRVILTSYACQGASFTLISTRLVNQAVLEFATETIQVLIYGEGTEAILSHVLSRSRIIIAHRPQTHC